MAWGMKASVTSMPWASTAYKNPSYEATNKRPSASAGEFRRMAALGLELASVHLLEDGRLLSTPIRLEGDPGSRLTRRLGRFEPSAGRVILNREGLCFEGIEPEVWRYQIGRSRLPKDRRSCWSKP